MRIFSGPAFGVARNEGGSPAVEFALAAPVLLLLMAAIIEFGMIMFVTVLMEGGIREAARWGITGQAPEDGDRAAHILEVVADRTLGLVDVSKATVEITVSHVRGRRPRRGVRRRQRQRHVRQRRDVQRLQRQRHLG